MSYHIHYCTECETTFECKRGSCELSPKIICNRCYEVVLGAEPTHQCTICGEHHTGARV